MSAVYVLIVVAALGWDGNAIYFQEFSDQAACEKAAGWVSEKLKKVGGNHGWSVGCVPKAAPP